jgi:hypothetical protein
MGGRVYRFQFSPYGRATWPVLKLAKIEICAPAPLFVQVRSKSEKIDTNVTCDIARSPILTTNFARQVRGV